MTAQRRHEIKWGIIFSALGALGGLGGAIIGGMLSVGGFVRDVKNDHVLTMKHETEINILIDSSKNFSKEISAVQQDVLKFSLHKFYE